MIYRVWLFCIIVLQVITNLWTSHYQNKCQRPDRVLYWSTILFVHTFNNSLVCSIKDLNLTLVFWTLALHTYPPFTITCYFVKRASSKRWSAETEVWKWKYRTKVRKWEEKPPIGVWCLIELFWLMSRPCSQKVTLSMRCESWIFSSWTAVCVALTDYACDSQTQTNCKTNDEWANHAGSHLLDLLAVM